MHARALAVPSSEFKSPSFTVPRLQLHGPLTDLTPVEEGKHSISLPLPVKKGCLASGRHKRHLVTLALPRKADANQRAREAGTCSPHIVGFLGLKSAVYVWKQ